MRGRNGKASGQCWIGFNNRLFTIALGAIAVAPLSSGITFSLSKPAVAADLNQQLTIYLNNRTRSSTRDEADRLLQLGKIQESDGRLADAIKSWQRAVTTYQDIGDQEAAAVTFGYLGRTYAQLGSLRLKKMLCVANWPSPDTVRTLMDKFML